MSISLFKDVILLRDLPEKELRAGDVGTVVEQHTAAGKKDGYSVEFFDMTGRSVAVIVVPENVLRAPTVHDRPAVRVVQL